MANPASDNKLEAAKKCRFTELPSELRLRIYELLFGDDFDEIYHDQGRDPVSALWLKRSHHAVRHVKVALKLAHTSRMLRAEALPACIKVTRNILSGLEASINEPVNSGFVPLGPALFMRHEGQEERRVTSVRCAILKETLRFLKALEQKDSRSQAYYNKRTIDFMKQRAWLKLQQS